MRIQMPPGVGTVIGNDGFGVMLYFQSLQRIHITICPFIFILHRPAVTTGYPPYLQSETFSTCFLPSSFINSLLTVPWILTQFIRCCLVLIYNRLFLCRSTRNFPHWRIIRKFRGSMQRGVRFAKPTITGIIGDMRLRKCDTSFDVSSLPEGWNFPIIQPVCSATAGNRTMDPLFI